MSTVDPNNCPGNRPRLRAVSGQQRGEGGHPGLWAVRWEGRQCRAAQCHAFPWWQDMLVTFCGLQHLMFPAFTTCLEGKAYQKYSWLLACPRTIVFTSLLCLLCSVWALYDKTNNVYTCFKCLKCHQQNLPRSPSGTVQRFWLWLYQESLPTRPVTHVKC